MTLTQERLKEVLSYNPENGEFTWLVDKLRVRPGERAGKRKTNGYIEIGIDKKKYQAHRLAFLYVTGRTPILIDHVNSDRSDNRWVNLREATNSQNQMNTRIRSNNTSGFKGVSWHKNEKKWHANIRIDGRKVSLGQFLTPEQAHLAYSAAAKIHHGEFARLA